MLSLRWRLFLSYAVIIAVGMLIVAAATDYFAQGIFSSHVGRMMGQGAFGGGMGGMMRNTLLPELQQAFSDALRQALLWAAGAASLTAVAIGLFVSQRIVAPLRQMGRASHAIAAGDYSQRVAVQGRDEVAELADSFNHMAASLADAEEQRRHLVADVAHELRTPLANIAGYMEGLVDGVVPPTAETFVLLQGEAGRLERLVDDLQRLSALEAGQERLERAELSPHAVVEKALRRVAVPFEDKGVAVENGVPSATPAVLADEDRLTQILLNLLGNALRYTPPGGRVSVSAAWERGLVALSVSDTGVGIAPEHLPHVFDRLYRVDESRSRSSGGSGIGLAIVRRLVEAHGGAIHVTSRVNEGTTFTFTLPLARGPDTPR